MEELHTFHADEMDNTKKTLETKTLVLYIDIVQHEFLQSGTAFGFLLDIVGLGLVYYL